MTREIYLEIIDSEHQTKQPIGKRYALYCFDGFRYPGTAGCDSVRRMGHMKDYSDYNQAKIDGIGIRTQR